MHCNSPLQPSARPLSLTTYCFDAGMNIYAAIFIIPFTVVLYTSTGGLKVCAPVLPAWHAVLHSFFAKCLTHAPCVDIVLASA